jgi:pimeloyl-ACP methyl ester carboxylesterase
MNGLGSAPADFAGWSLGGNEVTMIAGVHPERVGHAVYLDGAYNWGDPAFVTAFKSNPSTRCCRSAP